jgi:hypothetical protein
MQYPYDPVGALGGLFAPAYIHGDQQSEDAVKAWTLAHPYSPAVGSRNSITQAMIDQQAAAPAPAAPAAAAPASNPQWAAMRAQMSPSDIATFQQQVSPAEFQAFMGAGATASAATPTPAAPAAVPAAAPAAAAQQPAAPYYYSPPQDYYGGG